MILSPKGLLLEVKVGMISKEEVYKIAKLARIAIDETKAENYAKDLSNIMRHVEMLQKVDVSSVEPMTHALGLKNVYRNDTVVESLPVTEALKNAPDVNGQFFRVPLIKEHNSDN